MTGGERNAGDGCHKVSNSLQGLVCQSSNPTIKEEWRTTTCDQADGVEHIHTLQRFQDGRALSIKINFGTRRLPVQVGPQRRLFLCLMEQAVKEVCTFWMEGFPIRVYLSVFCRRSRPKVFYKLISSRTGSGYKYSRTEASKIYDIYIQQIQKDLVAHVWMENQAVLAYLEIMGAQEIYSWFRKQRKYGNFVLLFLNTRVDKASRVMKSSSSEWILNKPMSMWICLNASSATIPKGT